MVCCIWKLKMLLHGHAWRNFGNWCGFQFQIGFFFEGRPVGSRTSAWMQESKPPETSQVTSHIQSIGMQVEACNIMQWLVQVVQCFGMWEVWWPNRRLMVWLELMMNIQLNKKQYESTETSCRNVVWNCCILLHMVVYCCVERYDFPIRTWNRSTPFFSPWSHAARINPCPNTPCSHARINGTMVQNSSKFIEIHDFSHGEKEVWRCGRRDRVTSQVTLFISSLARCFKVFPSNDDSHGPWLSYVSGGMKPNRESHDYSH